MWTPNWERHSVDTGGYSFAGGVMGSMMTARSASSPGSGPRSIPRSLSVEPQSHTGSYQGSGTGLSGLSSVSEIAAESVPGSTFGGLGSIPREWQPGTEHRRSTVLSRRNSSVWLATAAVDMTESAAAAPDLDSDLPLSGSVGGSFGLGWKHARHHRRGPLSLDMLPIEILVVVLAHVAMGPDGNYHLYKLLSTCGRLYDVGVALLYRHVIFRYPHTFDKFRWSIKATGYGQHVRVLDFSAFTSVGLGRTMRLNMEIEMVTARTILAALDECPQLVEFLAAESIDTDLCRTVIDKLLGMPMLQAVDFCGSAHPAFVNSLLTSEALGTPGYTCYNLTRVSLHSCGTVPSETLEALLARLANVRKLDLTHTQVTGTALLSLPPTARLTHLFLARCGKLDAASLVTFFETHPAVQNSMMWLSLQHEVTRPSPVTLNDLVRILRALPAHRMCYLDASGHKPPLDLLTRFERLEAVSLAHCTHFSLVEIRSIMCQLRHLRFINLAGTVVDAWTVQDEAFLSANPNIDMFELGIETLTLLDGVKIPGYVVDVGRGRRGWLHRLPPKEPDENQHLADTRPSRPFTFAQLAHDRMAGRTRPPPPPRVQKPRPPPPSDPIWDYAAHKLNVSEIGQGPATVGTEGIYNYYAFHSN